MKNSIICTTAEVRGLLDGSITELFLPLKPQPIDVLPMKVPGAWVTLDTVDPNHGSIIYAPYKPGQIIKVRETWADFEGGVNLPFDPIIYKADDDTAQFKWCSPVTMPLSASRLSLRVLDVHVKKLDQLVFVVSVEVMK
jgi:hypothetical protein